MRINANRMLQWLAILIVLLGASSCKPFDVTARIEPNLAEDSTGEAADRQFFDVSLSISREAIQSADAGSAASPELAVDAPIATPQRPTPIATPTSIAPPTETAVAIPTPLYPALRAKVALNVRSGPGTTYRVIGNLTVGQLVQVLGSNRQRTWLKIEFPNLPSNLPSNLPGQQAWVSANSAYVLVHHLEDVPAIEFVEAVETAMPLIPTATPTPISLVFHTNLYGENDLFTYSLSWDGNYTMSVLLCSSQEDDSLVAVSPEGRRLAFVSDQTGNKEIFVFNLDSNSLTRLTFTDAAELWPSWSPDGKKIAFDSARAGNREIYVIDLANNQTTRLTDHPAEDGAPSWSPDGSKLVFHSDREGNHEIYTMGSDGGNLVRLTNHPADEWAPDWSPDGSQIAFMSYRDGSAEIYVMNTSGGNLRNLTNNPAEDALPAWSPDGRLIAFESNRNGNSDLYLMSAEGWNVQQLTYSNSSDGRPAWVTR